jgi:S-(hydroxymethyl)glutathione dehydrogenase/alcohol dehydrogenase
VLVLGFGGVGMSAALILQSYPNIDITIVESSKSRRELATQLGFHKVMSEIDFSVQGELKFDFCFESGGTSESIELGFRSIKDEATLVFASHPRSGDLIHLDPYDLIKGKTIKGTWGGGLPPEVMIKEIGERLLKSPADLSLLIGPKFHIARINEGLTYLADGKPGKPLIDFGLSK